MRNLFQEAGEREKKRQQELKNKLGEIKLKSISLTTIQEGVDYLREELTEYKKENKTEDSDWFIEGLEKAITEAELSLLSDAEEKFHYLHERLEDYKFEYNLNMDTYTEYIEKLIMEEYEILRKEKKVGIPLAGNNDLDTNRLIYNITNANERREINLKTFVLLYIYKSKYANRFRSIENYTIDGRAVGKGEAIRDIIKEFGYNSEKKFEIIYNKFSNKFTGEVHRTIPSLRQRLNLEDAIAILELEGDCQDALAQAEADLKKLQERKEAERAKRVK